MIAYVFSKYPENFTLQLFLNLQKLTREICYFLKRCFLTVSIAVFYKQDFTAQKFENPSNFECENFSAYYLC